MTKRRCARCKKQKPLSQFGQKSNGNLRSYCRPCKSARSAEYKAKHPERVRQWNKNYREWHPIRTKWKYLRKYGLTRDDFDKMVLQQEGRCAICHEQLRKPNVDHNHTTGAVRKLLCSRCNAIVGLIETRPIVVRRVISYLKLYENLELFTPDRK